MNAVSLRVFLSSKPALMLMLTLAVACKGQTSVETQSTGGVTTLGGATGRGGAASSAGSSALASIAKDTSSLIAPVLLPWVPNTDDPTCQHVAIEISCTNGWCRIPAGCFVAGSPDDEAGRGMYNEDLATVQLTRGFEIGRYEVTRADWSKANWSLPMEVGAMSGWNVCNEPNCPMTRVSLFAAMSYANWLSTQAGLASCYTLNNCNGSPEYTMTCESVSVSAASVYECEGYRLPTEVEWEYAARAGARTTFFAGPMSPAAAKDIANCVQEPALDDWDWYCFNTPDNRAQPVGKKGANAWGLHDIQGNVMEFVSNPRYTRLAPGPAIDPWGNVDTSLTMAVRGGVFSGMADYSRLACRRGWRIGGDAATGFRLVRSLKQ